MSIYADQLKQRHLLDDDRADIAAALTALIWLWDDLYLVAHKLTINEMDRISDNLRTVQGAVLVAHKHLSEPKGESCSNS